MQKYKIIVRGCKSNPGGVKRRNKKARNAKKPKAQLRPCPLSSPSCMFPSNLQLAHACTKTKTHNMKLVAFNLTISTISIL